MRTTAKRTLAVLSVAAFGLATACSGSKGRSAAATSTTPSTAAATTSTTVGVDQIPAVITVEYAQRVMNSLDRLEGDLTRLLVAKRLPTTEWRQMLTALYDEPAFAKEEASFGREAAHELDAFLPQPGNPISKISRILDSSESCLLFESDRDFGPELREKPSPDQLRGVVFLRPKNPTRDPLRVNPTAWAITADGQAVAGADLGHACH